MRRERCPKGSARRAYHNHRAASSRALTLVINVTHTTRGELALLLTGAPARLFVIDVSDKPQIGS